MSVSMLILTADPSLGRVDYMTLSDQTLMELLIEGFDDKTKKRYQDDHGMYLDVCEWPFIKCDDDERVIKIDIDSLHVSGSIELCYVPPKVKVLNISLWWGTNELTGSVDLTSLPDGMESLSLNYNQLTGGIDLTQLPKEMQKLHLYNNKLTGGIDLTQLPDRMSSIFFSNNEFTGEIDATHLPDEMEYLIFNNNKLSGSLIMRLLPRKMKSIDARVNYFNSVAVVDSKALATIKLRGSGVMSVVNENGKELDTKRFLE